MGDARPLKEIIKDKEVQMKEAAHKLEFELAAILRDEIRELKAREVIQQTSGSSKITKGRSKPKN
jgi:excinuclease UvrABC helicase subunit UvrB